MKENDNFIKAYHEFRDSIDLSRAGILPDLENLVWYMMMGVPHVPADEESSDTAPMVAVEQRVTILKAVFAEVNKNQPREFVDQGLDIYDEAGKRAKKLLEEEKNGQHFSRQSRNRGQGNGKETGEKA
jgi:hypothetical protein